MNALEKNDEIISIIILGRGGQGAVTACELIAEAAYLSGNFKDVHAYPSFGAERRGAPVQAYAKLSRTEKIWDRAQIEHPDILIVFDETVLDYEVVASLKKSGIFIINSNKEPEFFANQFNFSEDIKVIVADISNLALKKNLTIEGNPVINTPILGLLSKALPDLTLENLKTVVVDKLGEKLGTLNFELIEQGYNLAKIFN
ncbi:MAG: 2-oxoacid:acceptor oxidoreductase family protein [Candidatus Heimdallarchaeota archaeon]